MSGWQGTLGPWHLKPGDASGFKTFSGEAGVYAKARPSDDFFILQIAELSSNVPAAEIDANARGIAAVPELVAALLCAPIIGKGEDAEFFRKRQDDWLRTSFNSALAKAGAKPSAQLDEPPPFGPGRWA